MEHISKNSKDRHMAELAKMALSGALAYTIHYGTAKIYNMVCVPDGFLGFLQGVFTNGGPWCQAGLSLMTHTQGVYSSIILVGLSRAAVGAITGA